MKAKIDSEEGIINGIHVFHKGASLNFAVRNIDSNTCYYEITKPNNLKLDLDDLCELEMVVDVLTKAKEEITGAIGVWKY